MTIKINVCKANIILRTHCEASTQLFCKIKTHMSDPEIVVKSKLNLICEVYISSNATNEQMNQDRQRQTIYNK